MSALEITLFLMLSINPIDEEIMKHGADHKEPAQHNAAAMAQINTVT